MPHSRVTVADLASEAEMDLDEALVTLWMAGLESLASERDNLPPASLKKARAALGLSAKNDVTSPGYWRAVLGIDSDSEWQQVLANLAIVMSPRSRRLPKGAVGKLRKHAASRQRPMVAPRKYAASSNTSVPAGLAPLEWRTIGREREVRCLTAQEIEGIHSALVEDFANTEDRLRRSMRC